jgi:CheY-like chemotaxis protein
MKSILLIDSSRENAELLEETLTRYHFHVVVAEGGIAAQRLTRKTDFNLILMEFLSLPKRTQTDGLGIEHLGEELGKSTALIRELRARQVKPLRLTQALTTTS